MGLSTWFEPPPDRIAVEQLRMVLVSAPFSFVLGAMGNVVVACVYMLTAPTWPLIVWAIASWIPVPLTRHVAQRFLNTPDPLADVQRYMRATVVLFTLIGILRGILPWIAFDNASPLAVTMLLCFMVAIQAGSMAFMSPVLPAFIGYTGSFLLLLAPKMLLQDEPVYWAIAAGATLFCVGVISSARRLSISFRNMIELRFQNVELVEHLRQETASAEAARIEAENANRAKSKFLAAASHDLRQPIHAQGLFLEVLARSELTSQQRDVLANARAACVASGEMLNTLLDFSRLEAGVVTVSKRAVPLQPLLNRIETELAPLADEKGIVYRLHETAVAVESDPALLDLILRNLISNAIRYTERGGVLIGCRRRGRNLVVEIWDTGIGIAPENQADIFREFHQLGNPERDRRKGLGLGLAITERLARALGHDLALRSELGRGSKFALTLPVTTAVQATDPLPLAVDDGVSLLGLCVLVIDDDETVRAGMQSLLMSWGAHCTVSETIEQAKALAGAEPPGLVICDYRLREQRTGAEAITALRSIRPDLPAILITGDTAPERLREAQASGVPLLHKPVIPADLHRKIVQVLALSEVAAKPIQSAES